jgi:hypothetical protein
VFRLSIGADVARGLSYLHGHSDDGTPHGPPVLHGDVKVRPLTAPGMPRSPRRATDDRVAWATRGWWLPPCLVRRAPTWG